MADVRVNGKRVPPLQSVDTLSILVNKLEAIRIGESDQLRFSQEGQLIGGK